MCKEEAAATCLNGLFKRRVPVWRLRNLAHFSQRCFGSLLLIAAPSNILGCIYLAIFVETWYVLVRIRIWCLEGHFDLWNHSFSTDKEKYPHQQLSYWKFTYRDSQIWNDEDFQLNFLRNQKWYLTLVISSVSVLVHFKKPNKYDIPHSWPFYINISFQVCNTFQVNLIKSILNITSKVQVQIFHQISHK